MGCRRGPPVDPQAEADGHYVAATSAYLKGNFKEAHVHYDEVRRLNPKDKRLPGAEGELLMSEQRIDEAVAKFEEAAQLDSKRATTFSRLGWLYSIKGEKAKATAALERALQLNPKDFNALEAKGDLALEEGQLDEAVARYLEAAHVAFGKAQAELVLKATAELVKAKQSARALSVLQEAKSRGITSGPLDQELGDRYVEASKWDDAIEAYSNAAQADPSIWELVAELHMRQGRWAPAEEAWKRALTAKDAALYHVGLGRLCLARKDVACAQRELDRALSTATGEEVRESMEIARLLASVGRKTDGLRLLRSVAEEEDQKRNVVLQQATARLASELGQLEVMKSACGRIAPTPCP
jgi:tetratricopeptide (TPR) repeat protein